MKLNDCFKEGLLKKMKPSKQYAIKSLDTSISYIQDAKDNLKMNNYNLVIFCSYTAMFLSTLILLVTYQLFNVGISLFYLVILFLCITYSPTFYKLLTATDNGELIDGLWMGQGRTNRWMGIRYAGSFSLYFCIVFFLLI